MDIGAVHSPTDAPTADAGPVDESAEVERRELTPMDVLVLLGAVVHGCHAGKVVVPMPSTGSGFAVSMRQLPAKAGARQRFEITAQRVTAPPATDGGDLPTKRAMPLPVRMQRAGLALPRGVYA